MKWETNDTTRPDGRWNYPVDAKTARLECIAYSEFTRLHVAASKLTMDS